MYHRTEELLHLKGFFTLIANSLFPMWIISCLMRPIFLEQDFPHSQHTKGVFPMWNLQCIMTDISGWSLFHIHFIYIYGFSPLWVYRWTMRLPLQMKLFPQSPHALSFSCIYFVRYIMISWEKLCHTAHSWDFSRVWHLMFSQCHLSGEAFPHKLHWMGFSPIWTLLHEDFLTFIAYMHCIHDIFY